MEHAIFLYYNHQKHNYKQFTNYHAAACFDTIVSSSGSSYSLPRHVTQVFQTQLLVIQFKLTSFTGMFSL